MKEQSTHIPKKRKEKGRDPSGGDHASGTPPKRPTPLVHHRTSIQEGMKPAKVAEVATGERTSTPTASLNKPGVHRSKTRASKSQEDHVKIRESEREEIKLKKKSKKVSFKEEKKVVSKRPEEVDTSRRDRRRLESEESNEESEDGEEPREELSEGGKSVSSEEMLSEEEEKIENAGKKIDKIKHSRKEIASGQEEYEDRNSKTTRQKKAIISWAESKSVMPLVEEEKQSVKDIQKKQVQAQKEAYKSLKAREQSERLLEQQRLKKGRDDRAEKRRKARDLQWQKKVGAVLEEEEVAPSATEKEEASGEEVEIKIEKEEAEPSVPGKDSSDSSI